MPNAALPVDGQFLVVLRNMAGGDAGQVAMLYAAGQLGIGDVFGSLADGVLVPETCSFLVSLIEGHIAKLAVRQHVDHEGRRADRVQQTLQVVAIEGQQHEGSEIGPAEICE